MSGPWVWLDGALVRENAARISPADRGFLLGDGLFETLRAYGGRPFRLAEHLARLEAGGARIGLELPGDLRDAVAVTLEANDLEEAAVRITVSRGVADPGLAPPLEAEPTVLVTARAYHPRPEWYTHGIAASFASGRVDEHRASAGLKQLGYLDGVLALREARAAGAEDALLLDTEGHVAEGAASNLFMLAGGVLRTPPLSCGILPGITRAVVLELAAARGLATREEPLTPAAVSTAEEAFLTSSLRELVPLTRLSGRALGNGSPGATTRALLEDYRRLARAPAAPAASLVGAAQPAPEARA
jgi:branched-chain amino acid aminotransferase